MTDSVCASMEGRSASGGRLQGHGGPSTMSREAEAMGQRIQELRQGAGLSQTQLAEAAGVSVGAVRNWEQGRRLPYFDAAWRLAKALGITRDELAGDVFAGEAPKKKRKGKKRP